MSGAAAAVPSGIGRSAQIAHQFSGAPIGAPEMLRCAKDLKLKARAVATNWAGLTKLPLPAIVELKDKTFIIGRQGDRRRRAGAIAFGKSPAIIKRAEFEYDWTGRVVLMARRASLADVARRFDVTWFLQAMHKYRHLLAKFWWRRSFCSCSRWSPRCSFRSSPTRS